MTSNRTDSEANSLGNVSGAANIYGLWFDEPAWRTLTAADVHAYMTDEFIEATAVLWGIPVHSRGDWGKWLAFFLQESDKLRSHSDLPTTPVENTLPMPSPDLGEGKEK